MAAWHIASDSGYDLVDVGAGLGVPYGDDEQPLDLDRLAERLATLAASWCGDADLAELPISLFQVDHGARRGDATEHAADRSAQASWWRSIVRRSSGAIVTMKAMALVEAGPISCEAKQFRWR